MAKIGSSKPWYIVISIFIAVVLWLYVTNVENPDVVVTIDRIPVTFVGETDVLAQRGLMVTEGGDATVDLRLQGKRNVLSQLDRKNIQIKVDLTQVTSVGGKDLAYEVVFPENVMTGSVSILSRSSYYIGLTIGKLAEKTVELRGEFDGSVADGFVADEFEFNPETVQISGEEDLVAQVSYALVTLSREDINQTVSDVMNYSLIGYNGEVIDSKEIRRSPDSVQATLPIVVVKEVPLEVTFIESPGSSARDITYTISPATISISGEQDDIAGVNSINVATIDLSKILTSSNLLYNIPMPTGVKNLSGAAQATVHITMPDLPIQTYNATNIEMTSIPSGYKAALVTKTVPVAIRGPREELDQIQPSSIRLVANLQDISATGHYTVTAKAYLDGYEDAGPVGEYKVVVAITG